MAAKVSGEVRAWLEARGLGDAVVLAVIPNAEYDRLTPAERRGLSERLEAEYQEGNW